MKPLSAPNVEGKTEWEYFDQAVGKAFNVPPAAIQKERGRMDVERDKKRK
jgi:hypothetical protein